MDPRARADQANSIINNPVFSDAFKMLEAKYTREMIATPPTEAAERDRWHYCLFVLNDVQTALTAQIQDLKLGDANTQKREKLKNVGTGSGRGKRDTKRTSKA